MFNIGILEIALWFVVFVVLVGLLFKLERKKRQSIEKKNQEMQQKLTVLQSLCEQQHVKCLNALDQLVGVYKQHNLFYDDVSPAMQEVLSEMFTEEIAANIDMVMEFRNQLVADMVEVRKMTDFNEVSDYMVKVDRGFSLLIDRIY